MVPLTPTRGDGFLPHIADNGIAFLAPADNVPSPTHGGGGSSHTTPYLHITAGIITAGFVRTGSDVPSLPVMSLKIKKMIGAGLKSAVKDHIIAGLWLEPAVFWRALITTV